MLTRGNAGATAADASPPPERRSHDRSQRERTHHDPGDRVERGPRPCEDREPSLRVADESPGIFRRPPLAVSPLLTWPAESGFRDVGRRIQDRRKVLLEYPVLEPGLRHFSCTPPTVPLLDVEQAFAHVLVFAGQTRRPRDWRIRRPLSDAVARERLELTRAVDRAKRPDVRIGNLVAHV